ncbi:putative secreted protein [Wickerhamomyces ciferrii]|uniref:Secreted protein n=1 Tax=Wickerhamomyces ciferrii (strain ATCC 14091 / BCRC 22168 / CBS 111 / JCM 3599 / NBRC 0793 / NRRL Y-1031 F-60-10) TaxID=1206466 RepID=K0KKX9_WICCF|nr:uncharacterized protein BN7_2341 [Wickerhamomyces ciferrii]CCH42797.1 putative secreted protein [Wickerhamomyces ciferrii]
MIFNKLWQFIISLTFLLSCIKASQKVALNLSPFAKECIFHELNDDDHSLVINYQVLQGGNFELDFEITSPKGESIIKQTNEKYADFLLKTFGLGEYTFCFTNPFNVIKKVEFSIELEHKKDSSNSKPKDKDSIISEHSLDEIDRNINKIEKISNYLRAREWRNMSTVESTNSRIFYLSISIILLMVVVSVGQALIVQFLFQSRTKNYV